MPTPAPSAGGEAADGGAEGAVAAFDGELLLQAEEAAANGPIGLSDAKKLWESACEGSEGITDAKWHTIEYITRESRLDKVAALFLKHALRTGNRLRESPVKQRRKSGGGAADSAAGSGPRLRVGTVVRLHGLVNQAALNGRAGTLQRFDDESGRWVVHLDGDEETVFQRILPANLEGVVQPIARGRKSEQDRKIEQLTEQIAAAKSVTQVERLREKLARLVQGDGAGSKLRQGQLVVLQDLHDEPELNGAVGRLLEYSISTNKWAVQLDDAPDDEPRRIAPDHLVLLPASKKPAAAEAYALLRRPGAAEPEKAADVGAPARGAAASSALKRPAAAEDEGAGEEEEGEEGGGEEEEAEEEPAAMKRPAAAPPLKRPAAAAEEADEGVQPPALKRPAAATLSKRPAGQEEEQEEDVDGEEEEAVEAPIRMRPAAAPVRKRPAAGQVESQAAPAGVGRGAAAGTVVHRRPAASAPKEVAAEAEAEEDEPSAPPRKKPAAQGAAAPKREATSGPASSAGPSLPLARTRKRPSAAG